MEIVNFTPLPALVGGVLIGLASLVVFAFLGRIIGISGIVGQLLKLPPAGTLWKLCFVAGLIASPLLYQAVSGRAIPIEMTSNTWILIAGGLLVGFGTRLGNGCTSGHGICGISRFSLRSIIATVIFMVVAIATNFFAN